MDPVIAHHTVHETSDCSSVLLAQRHQIDQIARASPGVLVTCSFKSAIDKAREGFSCSESVRLNMTSPPLVHAPASFLSLTIARACTKISAFIFVRYSLM